MGEFKAGVQFEINDPELARKLLDLSQQLVIRGDVPRVSYGSAGKALVIALMNRPDLVAELLGMQPPPDEGELPKLRTARRR